MNAWDAMVLGLVQGLTEYLPVSSSGHLVLGRLVLDVKEADTLFDVVVHVATLVVTLVFYRQTVLAMLSETFAMLRELPSKGVAAALEQRPDAKLALLIVLGTVPTGIIGVVFKDALESLFAMPKAASSMLLVTAGLLVAASFVHRGERGIPELRARDAFVIGLVQGFAIIPGISRSGSTIAAAMFLRMDRELAAKFSFLLSVPAILGALVLKVADLGDETLASGAEVLATGFVAALLTGFIALALLLPMVRSGKLHYFAYYLVPVSVMGILWS